jgi:murein DD-endopeptidase MepM/ murein hydrolase activator NlpD
MVERSTSKCRLCPTRGDAVRRLLRAASPALILFAVASLRAQAQDLSVEFRSRAVQPGELLVVDISAPSDVQSVTVTAFEVRWPAVRTGDGKWRALVGIDLDQKPGARKVSIESAGRAPEQAVREITVLPKRFPRRVLKVAPDYVNPPPDVLARITSDAEFLRAVYERSAPEPAWQAGFSRPVSDPANSSFGSRSVFNGEPRSPHAGTDFLSPTGTPVHAPASGRVVAARELFFTGNTVIIDHGLGVFSMLAHLSRIDIHAGDDVTGGEIVGLVGATGRVTGPHLHWALRVGPARVDALSALALLVSGR